MDFSIKINQLIRDGRYLDAQRLMTTSSDQSTDPLYLEISYLFYIENNFNQCLFYLKNYLVAPPSKLPKMAIFLISEMTLKFNTDNELKQLINNLNFTKIKPNSPLDCEILNLDLILVDPAFYVFQIRCPHCNHQLEINTFATFLIDIQQPCPNCFHPFNFNFNLIKKYFESLSINKKLSLDYTPLDVPPDQTLPYYFANTNGIAISMYYFMFLQLIKNQ